MNRKTKRILRPTMSSVVWRFFSETTSRPSVKPSNLKQRKNRTKRLFKSRKTKKIRGQKAFRLQQLTSKGASHPEKFGGYTIPGYADMTDTQKHQADADFHVENARRFMTKYGVSDNIQNAHIMGHLYANNMI